MKTMRQIIFAGALLWFSPALLGQTDENWLAKLAEEESLALEALVLYPEDIREDIFIACGHPELLVRLASLQQESAEKFEVLLKDKPLDLQEAIWDLSRYEGLIPGLAGLPASDKSALNRLLQDYPEVIHKRARDSWQKTPSLIREAAFLMERAETSFAALFQTYPPETANAFHNLIEYPELLSLLHEEIRLSIVIGDWYARDPAYIRYLADSLGTVVARQQVQELEDWKNEVDRQKELGQDLSAVAADFESSYGYDDQYYAGNINDDLYYDNAPSEQIEVHYYYHYPYWLGYPYWYSFPRWRPLPFWYEVGFHYYPGRSLVIVRLPSIYFTNWYFSLPQHHYRYPRLSRHFINHYYGHRNSTSSIPTSVRVWKQLNREVVNDNWLRDDGKLEYRLGEFGKFEEQRLRYNDKNPDRKLSPAEFLDKKTRRYPDLEGTTLNREPSPSPRIKLEMPRERVTEPRVLPSTKPDKRTNSPKPASIEKAKDIHRNTWTPDRKIPTRASATQKTGKTKVSKTTKRKKTGTP